MIAVIALLGGGTDLVYASVRSSAEQLQARLTNQLQAGQAELEEGKTSLTRANKVHDAYWAIRAGDHFAAAKEKFLAAGTLADNSQLLRDLELLPSAGNVVRAKHAAVSGIAAMGAAISDAGQVLAALDAQIIAPPSSDQAGRTLLTVLDQTNAGLAKVKAGFDKAQKVALAVDVSVVPSNQQGAFLKARDVIASALDGFAEFERLVPVLKEVLGGNGARLYMVEQVNPAELRAGGGFIGTYSLVHAENGKLSVISSGDSYSFASARPQAGQPGFIPLPDPLRDVIPWVSWSFIDSNAFPDFPSNAIAAEQFVHPNGKNLDGVISIDYYAVAAMLELTGPLSAQGITVNGTNFISTVMSLELAGDPKHKSVLSAISGALMERIAGLPADGWPALLGAFNDLAASHHLQAYFNNSLAETELERVGWSGATNPNGTADFMMEVEKNIGAGKVNYWLLRHYTVELTRIGSVLHHRVAVDLTNNTPYRVFFEWDYYRAYASLYVPSAVLAAAGNLRPARYANPPAPSGMTQIEGWLPRIQCCGSHGGAVFEYDTTWPTRDRGSHQIYWQKQPGTVNDSVQVIWNDGSGHSYRTDGDLGQDRIINLSATGVTMTPGHPAQATLPSLSLG